MRSADQELKARVVIRNRALDLFAERGPDAVSLREIAAAAGVSPGLVIHHYGSKAGLRDEVDTYVAGIFDRALDALAQDPGAALAEGPAAATTFTELMLADLPPDSSVPAYLRRLLLSGDPAGRSLFARWYAATAAVTAGLADAGLLRPTADPAVRAAFLLVNDLAVLLLRDHLTDVLDLDPLSTDGMRRWAADLLSVYAHGVFVTEET